MFLSRNMYVSMVHYTVYNVLQRANFLPLASMCDYGNPPSSINGAHQRVMQISLASRRSVQVSCAITRPTKPGSQGEGFGESIPANLLTSMADSTGAFGKIVRPKLRLNLHNLELVGLEGCHRGHFDTLREKGTI